MQPELFQTKPTGSGGNAFKASITAFYQALAEQRGLSIVEETQKTLLLHLAEPIGEDLARGKLTVADQKALEMINEIISNTDLATGKDEEIDALTETMKALTEEALTQKGGVDRD